MFEERKTVEHCPVCGSNFTSFEKNKDRCCVVDKYTVTYNGMTKERTRFICARCNKIKGALNVNAAVDIAVGIASLYDNCSVAGPEKVSLSDDATAIIYRLTYTLGLSIVISDFNDLGIAIIVLVNNQVRHAPYKNILATISETQRDRIHVPVLVCTSESCADSCRDDILLATIKRSKDELYANVQTQTYRNKFTAPEVKQMHFKE